VHWSDTLLAEMQHETDAVLAKHAFGKGGVLNALTTNQTTVTPSLAAFYGFTAPGADGVVDIPRRMRAPTAEFSGMPVCSA
jgi:hypothetical protein